jgi:hypothetical protein
MPVLSRTRPRNKIGEVHLESRAKLENTVLFILGQSLEKRAIALIFPSSCKLELFVYAIVEFFRCSKVNLMYSATILTGITQLADGGGAPSIAHSGVESHQKPH